MQEGWLCPKCGKVLAPWREECDHVIRMSFKFTIPATPYTPSQPLWETANDPRAATTWSKPSASTFVIKQENLEYLI